MYKRHYNVSIQSCTPCLYDVKKAVRPRFAKSKTSEPQSFQIHHLDVPQHTLRIVLAWTGFLLLLEQHILQHTQTGIRATSLWVWGDVVCLLQVLVATFGFLDDIPHPKGNQITRSNTRCPSTCTTDTQPIVMLYRHVVRRPTGTNHATIELCCSSYMKFNISNVQIYMSIMRWPALW